MTKFWRRSLDEKHHTEAFMVDGSGWKSDWDHSLGVSRWEQTDPSHLITVEVKSTHPPDDFFDKHGAMFIVSERLKRLLDESEVHAEYLPLRIIYHGEDYTDRKFFCCNILDAVDCFDLERGEFTFFPSGNVDKIVKFAIDEEKVAGYHLFRIGRGGTHHVCASDVLAERVAASGFTGMRFLDVDKWPQC